MWEPDDHTKLGGWVALAGRDPSEVFGVRGVNHPWVGLEISFPFEGFGNGKIVKCLTHPKGQFMFDVEWDKPVPPVHYNLRDGYHAPFDRDETYYSSIQRYMANKLIRILGMEEVSEDV
jgi:hypothetical protein